MISYKECEELVGVKPEYPTKEYRYRAYKNGNCKIFDNLVDASKYSPLVEKFQLDESEYKQKLDEYYNFDTKVYLFWMNKLKEEFDLPEKIFDICYAQARERHCSSGYDAVANGMLDVVEFYENIMKAVKDE